MPQKRRTTRRRGGAATAQKPKSYCQCTDANTGKGCTRLTTHNSLFCDEHQNCPGSPLSGYEPAYEPEKWNNDPAVYKAANCYSYFANRIDGNMVSACRKNNHKECRQFFPQPGALNGDRFALNASERRSCDVVDRLIRSDIKGLQPSTFYAKCPAGTSKGALVVDKGNDYHFYRQDSDGMWSHKDGSNTVKRFDALKRQIFNPEHASRDYRWQGSDLNYRDFCGFYCVPRDKPIPLGQGGSLKVAGASVGAGKGSRRAIVEKPLGASWRDHRQRARAKTRKHRR